MPRPSKSSKTTAVTTDRRLQALKLRQQGLQYQEIADELGISKPAAWMLVDKALSDYREAIKEEAKELVELSLMQLDALLRAHLPVATAPGKPDDRSANIVLKTISERAKLMGLYAPTKTELTGKDGGPVATSTAGDYSKLSTEELAALATLLKKAEDGKG